MLSRPMSADEVAAMQERIAATPPPPDLWTPGDLGRGVWDTTLSRYVTYLANPETGELELDTEGNPVRAAWEPPEREQFVALGMGYRMRWTDNGAELRVEHLRMRSGELGGMVRASVDRRQVAFGRLNLSSLTTRNSFAKLLKERAKGIDWSEALERFCVLVLAAESEGEPFQLVGQKPKREAVPYLLHPILPRDRATIVFGEGGTGKSYLAAAIAVTVQTGTPVIRGWHPTNPGPVLILDWEADDGEWNDRIAAICKAQDIAAPQVHYRNCVGSLTEQVEDVARHVSEAGIVLVIVDSVGMATPPGREGGDANEGAIRMFEAIRHLRTTALLIDHVTGADQGRDKVLKPYGSIYKVNLARSVYELRRADDDHEQEDGIAHVALYHRKANGAALQKPTGLRYAFATDDDGTIDEFLINREDVVLPELVAGMSAREQIEHVLLGGPLAPVQIETLTGLKGGTVRKTLKTWLGDRFVRLDDGRYSNAYKERAA
jgi:hypothetical protein